MTRPKQTALKIELVFLDSRPERKSVFPLPSSEGEPERKTALLKTTEPIRTKQERRPGRSYLSPWFANQRGGPGGREGREQRETKRRRPGRVSRRVCFPASSLRNGGRAGHRNRSGDQQQRTSQGRKQNRADPPPEESAATFPNGKVHPGNRSTRLGETESGEQRETKRRRPERISGNTFSDRDRRPESRERGKFRNVFTSHRRNIGPEAGAVIGTGAGSAERADQERGLRGEGV